MARVSTAVVARPSGPQQKAPSSTALKIAVFAGAVGFSLAAVLAFALGLPLSYHGLVCMNFKTAKQMTDCRNDLYTGVAAARGMPQQQLDAIEAAFKRSIDCNSNVDPRISNLDFAKQQHQRWRDASVGTDPSAPRR